MRLRGKKWGRKSVRSPGPQSSRPRESCAGFKKAGGPPFLDMRPSDVGRRLSLHVQSPPPIASNIEIPQHKHFLRSQTLRLLPGFVPFHKVAFESPAGAARTPSARCFDADPDLAKQNAPRSNAPASPARQMCSDPNRILHVCEPDEIWLTRLYGVDPPKGTNVFLPPSSRPTSTTFINKGLLCEARVNCQARYRKDFFAVIASSRASCEICASAS